MQNLCTTYFTTMQTPTNFTALYTTMGDSPVIEESVYFAYDAVLALALGLEAAIDPLAEDCGTSLEDLNFHLKADECAGRVIRDSISNVQFNGVSVSVHHTNIMLHAHTLTLVCLCTFQGYIMFQNGSRVTHDLHVLQYQQCKPG